MDKSVDAGDYLCKCAVGGHADDLYLYNIADSVLIAEYLPRIFVSLLVAERDLVLFKINSLYIYIYGVANLDNL